jgi:hypothetical protein
MQRTPPPRPAEGRRGQWRSQGIVRAGERPGRASLAGSAGAGDGGGWLREKAATQRCGSSHEERPAHQAGVTPATSLPTMDGMTLPPDQPPPASSPAKPKMSAEERRIRQADRLASIRLRMAIGRELDERGITDPHAIGDALGIPTREAAKLLTRHQWREGDVALLEAAAARLGVRVPAPAPWPWPG